MTATATPAAPASTVTVDAPALAARLRETFASGRTRPAEWRRAQLEGLRRLLAEREEELIEALRVDLGRPRAEALAADLGHSRVEIRHMLKHFERWMKPRRAKVPLIFAPGKASIQPEPLGVTLVIAPWNYPIQLLVEPVAAALAAGNCVVGKPSEISSTCSAAIARLMPQYLDSDAVTIVEGGVPETTALLEERWDHIFFTGSTAVGRVVAEAAAKHLTPTTLELGGKSPTYVHASADLDTTARRIAFGKFLNAGQTCIAPDYVLADRSIRDAFVSKLVDTLAQFYGDDPRQSNSFSRVVSARHLDRLQGLLADGGGTVVTGGNAEPSDRYLAPTVTVDPDPESRMMTEEIFGPILPVLSVDGPDDAVAFVTKRPKPLALYVFAEDGAVADDVLSRTTSGGSCVNHTLFHIGPPDLPFGGVGDSGWGAYHGQAGFDRFSHRKSVLRKRSKPDVKLLYPPYSRLAERIIKATFK